MTNSPTSEERIPLTDAQRAEINTLKAAQDWPQVYRRLEEFAHANGRIKPEVSNWYHLAAQINEGKGPLALYVRSAMMISAARKRIVLTPQAFQVASDNLALGIVDRILKEGLPVTNAETLIEDVVKSTADVGLLPEDWAGSAANAIKQGYQGYGFEWVNKLLAVYKDLPYRDIGTFDGKVFGEDFEKFKQAGARQNTASSLAHFYQRPQALDFLLTESYALAPAPGFEHVAETPMAYLPTGDLTQLDSALLSDFMTEADWVALADPNDPPDSPAKQKWQKYLKALHDDPRIGAPYGVSAAELDKLYLVSEEGMLHLNTRPVTTLTPAEAVQRQQMRAVRAMPGAMPSLPTPSQPTLPLHPHEVPGLAPTAPLREGRLRSLGQGGAAAALTAPSVSLQDKEQKGITLSFAPPPALIAAPEEREGARERIALPVAASEDRPLTLRDLHEAQEALLIDLHIAETNRPPPEIDIYKIRDLLDRAFDQEVKCGRTFYSDVP